MTFRSRGWEGGGSQQAVSTMKGGVSHGDAPVRARPKDRAMPRPASLLRRNLIGLAAISGSGQVESHKSETDSSILRILEANDVLMAL